MSFKSLFILLILNILITSCSIFETDCNDKNWYEEGRTAQNNTNETKKYFTETINRCSKGIKANAEEEFNKGVAYQRPIKCTGFNNYYTEGWAGLGNDIATRGDQEEFYLDLKNCAGITPTEEQLNQYKTAYAKGITFLCTKAGGVDFSRNGHVYKSTCPKNTETEFFRGNAIGIKFREIDVLKNKSKANSIKIDELQKFNDDSIKKISSCETRLKEIESGSKSFSFFDTCTSSTKETILSENKLNQDSILKNNLQIRDLLKENSSLDKDADRLYKELEIIHLSK